MGHYFLKKPMTVGRKKYLKKRMTQRRRKEGDVVHWQGKLRLRRLYWIPGATVAQYPTADNQFRKLKTAQYK